MGQVKLLSIVVFWIITTILFTSCTDEKKETNSANSPVPTTNEATVDGTTDTSELTTKETTSVDESKYDDVKEEDARLAKIAIDYFEAGNFEKSEEFMREALEIAIKDDAPKLYIDNLKTKLSTILINLKRYDEWRALLKEVHGVDTPQ